jgi:hypothetical protein
MHIDLAEGRMKRKLLLILMLSVLSLLALFPTAGGVAGANAPEAD